MVGDEEMIPGMIDCGKTGAVPVLKGDPDTALRAPLELIEYAETLLDPWLAAKRNLPCGSMASPVGVVPAATADPIAVRDVPDALKASTLFPLESAT